jgi:hypothetical protein
MQGSWPHGVFTNSTRRASCRFWVRHSSAIYTSTSLYKYLIHYHSDTEKELAAGVKFVDFYVNTTTWCNTFLYLSTSFETNIKLLM